jgi:hypothetical protein
LAGIDHRERQRIREIQLHGDLVRGEFGFEEFESFVEEIVQALALAEWGGGADGV